MCNNYLYIITLKLLHYLYTLLITLLIYIYRVKLTHRFFYTLPSTERRVTELDG